MHDPRKMLRHRISVVRVRRTWYVKEEGIVSAYDNLDAAATHLARFWDRITTCCPDPDDQK